MYPTSIIYVKHVNIYIQEKNFMSHVYDYVYSIKIN